MSNVATIEEDNVPYLEITTNKQPYNNYFESLSRNLTLENCNANIIKNIWTWCILGHSGEQRNTMAWDFWNKVPDAVKTNTLNYVIFVTIPNVSGGGLGEQRKLTSDLQTVKWNDKHNTLVSGISIDISHKHVFSVDTLKNLFRWDKDGSNKIRNSNNNGYYGNHITYGDDNFLYISSNIPSIEKYDSISLYKVQENTELWVENCTYDYYNIDSSLLPDSPTFEDYFNSSYASNTTTGANWLYPCFSYIGSGTGYSFQFPDYAHFMNKPSFLSTDYYGLVIYGTFKVQNSSETFDVEIGHNGGVEFSVNGSVIGGLSNAGIENSDTERQQLQINDGDTFTLRMQEKNDTDGLVFISKQKDRNERYNIPNFSGEFQYMNYDSTGPWLWVQNNYGVFKWDPQRMLVREAQPITGNNEQQINGDIIISKNNIIVVSKDGITKLNKDLSLNTSTTLIGTVIQYKSTLHSLPNGNILACCNTSNNENTVQEFDPTNLTEVQLSPDYGEVVRKISVLPDGTKYIGFDTNKSSSKAGHIYILNDDLSLSSTFRDLGNSCTGIVYDIEGLS